MDYFRYSLEQCPQTMIDFLIKSVKVYADKIEITFNYTKRQDFNETPQTLFLFNEQVVNTRRTRGDGVVTKTQEYKVYIQV